MSKPLEDFTPTELSHLADALEMKVERLKIMATSSSPIKDAHARFAVTLEALKEKVTRIKEQKLKQEKSL